MTFAHWILIVLVALAFYTDAVSMRIPNKLTGASMIVAVSYYVVFEGWQGIIFSVMGLTVAFVILLPLYLIGAVAAGDVKLFSAIGALSGVHFALYSLTYSLLYGGIIGFYLLLRRKEITNTLRQLFWGFMQLILFKQFTSFRSHSASYIRFPFMYAVVPGVISAFWHLFSDV